MEFRVRIPFVELLGMELVRFEPREAEIVLPMRDELTNSWGVTHGGVTMTLLDVAMAHAARSPDAATGVVPGGVVTVEMKTSFVRPGLGTLRAIGRLLHRTSSMAFTEGTVVDEQGELLAHASGTFKFMKGLPAGGRNIQRSNASD
jgi:uncharacterized protein (TIGR00369 family)